MLHIIDGVIYILPKEAADSEEAKQQAIKDIEVEAAKEEVEFAKIMNELQH